MSSFVWRRGPFAWAIGSGITANFCTAINGAGKWESVCGTRLFILTKKSKRQ